MLKGNLKYISLLICIISVIVGFYTVSVYAGTIREWNMDDEKFSNVNRVIEDTNIDGLTLHTGISMRESLKLFKGTKLNKYLYMDLSTDRNSCSVSFHLNGPSDIYIVGRSDGVDARKTEFYYTVDGRKDYLYIGEAKGYKLEYRGDETDVYVNSVYDDIRVYEIAVEDYVEGEHTELEAGNSYYWDFNGISNSDTYTEPTDFIATNDTSKKLTVNATAENNVSGYLGETTDSGYRFYKGLNMNGTGSRFYRSVAFDVPKNADIYITARCSSGTKNLYVTNKYECNLEDFDGVLTDSKFPLSENTKTYRIRYRGNGEKIYLKSEKDSIRFYKIEVVGTSDKIINDQKWVFDEYNELSIGNNLYDNTIDNLQIKSNSSRPASVVASSEEEFTKAIRMTSSHFDEASKLIFDISDSSDNSSATTIRSNRVIRVKAKGTATDTRLILGNQYGYVYGCYNLSTDLKEYIFNYNGGNEKLYLFTNNIDSSHNTSEIYSISTSDLQTGGPIAVNYNFTEGNNYKYNFTVENIPETEEYYYSIKYDSDKLTLLNIGKDYNNGTVITDSDVQVISNQPGEIRFRIINLSEENWSGLVTSAVFTANVSGSAPIKFSVIRG